MVHLPLDQNKGELNGLSLTNLESEDCEGKHDASGDPSSNDDCVHIIEHTDLRTETIMSLWCLKLFSPFQETRPQIW